MSNSPANKFLSALNERNLQLELLLRRAEQATGFDRNSVQFENLMRKQEDRLKEIRDAREAAYQAELAAEREVNERVKSMLSEEDYQRLVSHIEGQHECY